MKNKLFYALLVCSFFSSSLSALAKDHIVAKLKEKGGKLSYHLIVKTDEKDKVIKDIYFQGLGRGFGIGAITLPMELSFNRKGKAKFSTKMFMDSKKFHVKSFGLINKRRGGNATLKAEGSFYRFKLRKMKRGKKKWKLYYKRREVKEISFRLMYSDNFFNPLPTGLKDISFK